MAKQYTIEQFLAAAKKAGTSKYVAQDICDTMEVMYQHPEVGTFRKVIEDVNFSVFKNGEVVKVIEVDEFSNINMKYKCENKLGVKRWLDDIEHEPTSETF